MSHNCLFQSAVRDLLPNSIPIDIDRVDDFAIGKVLIYKKKPRRLIPSRRHKLEVTEWTLDSLLPESKSVEIATTRKFLYNSGSGSTSVNINVNLEANLDLSQVSKWVGGSLNLKGGEDKTMTMKTDFGKITHITSDLTSTIIKKGVAVNVDHPLVKIARDKGNTFFVVHTVYEAEHCNLSISVSEDIRESGKENLTVMAKEDVSEKVEKKHSSSKVVERPLPTPLSYLVLKVEVDSKGRLSAKLQASRSADYTDGSGKPSDPYKGWVVVEREADQSNKVEADPNVEPPQKSEASKPEESSEPVVEEPCVMAVSADNYSAPPPSSAPMATNRPIPHDLDEHFLFSLKDFQPFQSKNYNGVLDEVKEWVRPLRSNPALKEAFLKYIKPPQTYERLNELSSYFFDLGDTMRADKPAPPNKPSNVEPILAALSEDKARRLDEISSVVVVAEAGDDFPHYTVQRIVELSKDKRKILRDLILETPYDGERHGFANVGPFNDSDLKPILRRIGYSVPSGGRNMQYDRRLVEDEDPLTAVLILLAASD